MKLSNVIVVAALLVAATALVVAPAFATPNATTSITSSEPFFTPTGDTRRSSVSAVTANMGSVRFSGTTGARGVVTVTCDNTVARGYVPATHTRMLITDLRIQNRDRGDGRGTSCAPSIGSNALVTNTANSTTPFNIHLTRNAGRGASWDGSLEIPAGQSMRIQIYDNLARMPILTPRCDVTFRGQSVRLTDTDPGTFRPQIAFTAATIVFTESTGTAACPQTAGNLTGTLIFGPEGGTAGTSADMLRSTLAS